MRIPIQGTITKAQQLKFVCQAKRRLNHKFNVIDGMINLSKIDSKDLNNASKAGKCKMKT